MMCYLDCLQRVDNQSEYAPIVSVPAPRLFQYMERSTMIGHPAVLEVTMMDDRPAGILSAML